MYEVAVRLLDEPRGAGSLSFLDGSESSAAYRQQEPF